MIIIRALLITFLSLLLLFVVITAKFVSGGLVAGLATIGALILILGPLWPNEKMLVALEKGFDKYPRITQITVSILGVVVSWYGTYAAVYSQKAPEFRRFNFVIEAVGYKGWAAGCFIVGLFFLIHGIKSLKDHA